MTKKECCVHLEKKLKAKVEEHPLIATGIGLGVGLLLGYTVGKLSK